VNEPPSDVDFDEVLGMVQHVWDPAVEALEYLRVGFGAHHWRATIADEPRYFVTLEDLGERHTLQSLEAAYAGAAALARVGLRFVRAPIEPFVAALGNRALSLTPWLEGRPVTRIDPVTTSAMLNELHAVAADSLGVELPKWRPVVGPDLEARLRDRVRRPWNGGPYGERGREAISAALENIGRWAARYLELTETARMRPWVPTHGEPDWHNQLVTASGTMLLDWETLKLAPAERDLQTLGMGDRLMLELLDLEWRLDEINEYANWFSGPHGDTKDDRIAFDGLLHEITR
jgi:spectinomycin phosphotransferase